MADPICGMNVDAEHPTASYVLQQSNLLFLQALPGEI